MFLISKIQENCFFLYILKNKFLKIENKNCYQTYSNFVGSFLFLFIYRTCGWDGPFFFRMWGQWELGKWEFFFFFQLLLYRFLYFNLSIYNFNLFFIYIFMNIRQKYILLQHNLNIYVYKTPFWRFKPRLLPSIPTSYKHLYLRNNDKLIKLRVFLKLKKKRQ